MISWIFVMLHTMISLLLRKLQNKKILSTENHQRLRKLSARGHNEMFVVFVPDVSKWGVGGGGGADLRLRSRGFFAASS